MKKWKMGLIATSEGLPTHCWVELDKFDPAVNSALKDNMPKPARFHGGTKRWIFPLSWRSCTGLRAVSDKFKATIQLTPAMQEWAVNERKHQETIPDVNSMELVDLASVRQVHPAIWHALSSRPFQTVGAAFAARNRSCLIADQPGLGKTVQSIAAIIESGIKGPILVVAPKAAAKLTWPQELKRWLPEDADNIVIIGAHQTPAQRKREIEDIYIDQQDTETNWPRVWVITSPNYLRIKPELDDFNNYVYRDKKKVINAVGETVLPLFDVQWSAVIVDESHQTLAGSTGNKKKQSGQRLGLGALSIAHNGLRLALSGTPFRGKENYIWGQLNWLRPDIYSSYWKFVEKYFDTWQDRYGMQIGRMIKAEEMYAEAKTVMIRRTKDEVAKDLPAKLYGGWPLDGKVANSPVAVWLDMLPQQAKMYDEMVRGATVQLDGGLLMANGLLAEMTRLKQFAGSCAQLVDGTVMPTLPSNKYEWLLEFLEERGISKSMAYDAPKIVIASQFSKLINLVADGLKSEGIHGWKFTGATSDKDREYIKNDWQNNPQSQHRVLLLTTTAGGVSLTLDAADELVVLDETWNPADQEQVEDRLHRLSRMHQVTIWNVRSLGTIEEGIARTNIEHEANIRDIIDGQRGIEFVKHALSVR